MTSKVPRWRCDPFQSYAIGLSLSGLKVERSQHELIDGPTEAAIWAETVFVAICHSTNWDRLHSHIMQVARANPGRMSPSTLAELTVADTHALLADGLEGALRDSRKDLAERHRLLVSLGTCASSGLSDRLNNWVQVGMKLGGSDGLYAVLDEVPAFSEDPLRKKSRILAHQLCGFRLVEVADPHNLAPAIDYHLIRLYMRTNRIFPQRSKIYDQYSVAYKPSLSAMTSIRQAVEDAMWYTAAGSGFRMDELNHVEWQIARSFCVRDSPRCKEGPLAMKPVDGPIEKLGKSRGGCPIVDECRAHAFPRLRRLQDPLSSKSYY